MRRPPRRCRTGGPGIDTAPILERGRSGCASLVVSTTGGNAMALLLYDLGRAIALLVSVAYALGVSV
jgi:hypothetical protein